MALVLATLVKRIEEQVFGSDPRLRPYETELTNSPSGGTSFAVADGDAWQVGDILTFPSASERCRVTAIATNTLTVVRDIDETGSSVLAASGDTVRKNPRFSYAQIYETILELVDEQESEGVFRLATETLAVTGDDWYDVADTDMQEVFSVWYLENGDFRTPFWHFNIDPVNGQPKLFVSALGYTGDVYVNYRTNYSAYTEMPDRLQSMIVHGAVYRLLGGAGTATSTHDPGKRTDRTVQGGQESRDSYWFLREYVRLQQAERVKLQRDVMRLPKQRVAARASRFRT